MYFAEAEKVRIEKESSVFAAQYDPTIPVSGSQVFGNSIKQVNNWELPKVDAQFELTFFDQKIKYRSPLFIPSSQVCVMIFA